MMCFDLLREGNVDREQRDADKKNKSRHSKVVYVFEKLLGIQWIRIGDRSLVGAFRGPCWPDSFAPLAQPNEDSPGTTRHSVLCPLGWYLLSRERP